MADEVLNDAVEAVEQSSLAQDASDGSPEESPEVVLATLQPPAAHVDLPAPLKASRRRRPAVLLAARIVNMAILA